MKKIFVGMLAVMIMALFGCGGGGSSGTTTDTTIKKTAAVTGTVSFPSLSAIVAKQVAATVASGTIIPPVLIVTDLSGAVIATPTLTVDPSNTKNFTYTVSLDASKNYVFKASWGGQVLRALADLSTLSTLSYVINITPVSTAAVLVAEKNLNLTFGKLGTTTASAITDAQVTALNPAALLIAVGTPTYAGLVTAVTTALTGLTDPTGVAAVTTAVNTAPAYVPPVTTPATLTSLTVTPAVTSIVVGTTQQFTATGTYSDASTKNLTGTVTWSSSNSSVASIVASGVASAVTAGSTTIKASSGTVTSTATLTVTGAASSTANLTATIFAGASGERGYIDGIGTAARFNGPGEITTDGTNLYVADTNNSLIRKIVISTGMTSILAGAPGIKGYTDGIGTAARFSLPDEIATDGIYVYVGANISLDASGTYRHIRKIAISTGEVTTLAGGNGNGSSVDAVGTAAVFGSDITAMTIVGNNLYVIQRNISHIRKVNTSTGEVTTMAGGLPSASIFSGLTTDGTNLYVADSSNHIIRKIAISTGEVTTLAGMLNVYGTADGMGVNAQFHDPRSIVSDGTNLYITDGLSDVDASVRKIVISTGMVSTVHVGKRFVALTINDGVIYAISGDGIVKIQ